MVRTVALSDTHTLYDLADAPDGDLLVIAGDILMRGNMKELNAVMLQLDMESHRWEHILIVPGNHDFALQQFVNSNLTWDKFADFNDILYYPQNMTISHEGIVEILGLKIFTWSWVPNLPRWAFHIPDEEIINRSKMFDFPEYVDLMVSHGPPHGVLDFIPGHGHVGSKTMEGCFDFKYNLHIFGHIHEGYGKTIRDKDSIVHTNEAEFRRYYNVSITNEQYEVKNKPIIFEI